MRDWIKPFSGQSDCHDIDVGLRALHRELAEELAEWMPRPWRAATRWTRWLALLPLFEHLARGLDMPAWTARDHDLSGLLDEQGRFDPRRLERHGAAGLLAPGADPGVVWLVQWSQLWPPCRRDYLRTLQSLRELLAAHLETFRRARPEDAWGLRRSLRERLRLRFHQQLLQPASPFVYLALTALDLERLRAELTTRALFATLEAA